jgi:hypothetical protein
MNTKLNKSVKKFLDDYLKDEKKNSPEHHESVMLIMRGALTDANFHSEAKQLGKYFPKAGKKFIGTPMEDVIESKGIAIAKAAKYDGHDIIDAFAFYLSMSIGGSFGNRLMSLKESLEESLVIEGERLDEKNCPTDASKWSYYKSQAKKKFDVYPSAYANGWASKQYKAAGGGWKQCAGESVEESVDENFAVHMAVAKAIADQKVKNPQTKKDVKATTALKDKKHPAHKQAKSLLQRLKDKFSKKESIDEKMITPQRGHNYYQLYRDTPIKYVSGHSGIGLKVPGVLLHNEYDTIKGKEGAYIIDYFGAHFYVDMKNKFASRIAHPDNREQNKDLRKNMGRTALAPEHKDWKKYMNESVNEAGVNVWYFYKKANKDKNKFFKMLSDFRKKHSDTEWIKMLNYALEDFNENPTKYKTIDDKQNILFKNLQTNKKAYESVNEGYGEFIKAKNLTDIIKLSKQKKNATFYVTDDNNSRIGAFYLKNGKFAKATTANPSYDLQNNKTKLRDRSDVIYKYKVDESVNEAKDKVFVVMFKDKKDLPNKNIKPSSAVYAKEADAKKFLKSVEKDGAKGMIVKSNKPVGVKVNESTTRTAMEIGGLTGMNKDAIQKFVDDNNLDIEKVYQFVKKGKLADRMKLVSAIAGKPNNPVQKKMVKQFGEGIIREAKVRLGKDSVNFKVMGDSKGLTLIAASGNDLDGLQGAVENDVDVKEELRKTLEKQLKVPVEVDRDYDGAGFRFNIDFYSLAKKVK